MLTGFQVLAFGLFTKAYAVSIGLLPGKEYWHRLVNGCAVEWGIGIGLVLMVSGLGLPIHAILYWKAAGFGPLPYQTSQRMVILAVTLISLGIQASVYGFALNILGLQR